MNELSIDVFGLHGVAQGPLAIVLLAVIALAVIAGLSVRRPWWR